MNADRHRDVLVIGAGLSGIGAAYRLQTLAPDRSYAILEARDSIGGTWDLFRYPGVRSDSDMFTLGYPFRPWTKPHAISDAASILGYIRDTADENGITAKIRFGQRVTAAEFSSADATWTVHTAGGDVWTCSFLYLNTGYYRYTGGYEADFAGRADFTGRIVHPQQWPADLDHAGRRVVVIGSGATAVTLVPAMARTAAHVTMVQRSPTHIVARPARDAFADRLRAVLPPRVAYRLIRAKNITLGVLAYGFMRRWPKQAATLIRDGVATQIGDTAPVDPHFTPRYAPWDQRLCLVPDGDFFTALRERRADVVTDQVTGFTPDGVRLASGTVLPADLVVTATGLRMVAFGEMTLRVDGSAVEPGEHLVYKGMMLSGVPNMAWTVGYANASWTLRADLTARHVCRLLNHMRRRHWSICVPTAGAETAAGPILDLTSGYVRRAAGQLPRQGVRRPWRARQNYLVDLAATRLTRVDDPAMHFTRLPTPPPTSRRTRVPPAAPDRPPLPPATALPAATPPRA